MRFLFALIVRLALFDYWSGSLNYSIQQNQFGPGANLRLFDNEIEFYRKLIHTSKKSSKVFLCLSMFFRGSATSYLRILQLDFSVTDKLHASSVLFNDFTSLYVHTRSLNTLQVLSSTSPTTKSSQKSWIIFVQPLQVCSWSLTWFV